MPRVSAFERDLRAAFRHPSDESIKLAARLVRGSYSDAELDAIPAVVELRHRCYSEPTNHHKVMTALDSLLETCGTEVIGVVHPFNGAPIEYLNTGDSYAATVVYYRDSRTFKVQCYADAVEWCERKGLNTEAY